MAEMTFAEILNWSKEQGMTQAELLFGAIKVCLGCEVYGRCENFRVNDWCHVACIAAINSWKEEKGLVVEGS